MPKGISVDGHCCRGASAVSCGVCVVNKNELNEWARQRLLDRAEQYVKDAISAKKRGWTDCVKSKLEYAEFCVGLAEHIGWKIQDF